MNKFMNHLTAALTVGLLSVAFSTASYSDNSSHGAMVDTYYDAYGDNAGKGMLAYTDDKGVTTLYLYGIEANPVKLCGIFGNMTTNIIVINGSDEMYYDCSL